MAEKPKPAPASVKPAATGKYTPPPVPKELKEVAIKIRNQTALYGEYEDYVAEIKGRIKAGDKDLIIPDFGDYAETAPREFIPTGIISFDITTGGGIPCGRISEVYGLESTCKTSLGMLAMDNCIAMNGYVLYNDAEQTCDKNKFDAWKAGEPQYTFEQQNNLDKWWEQVHNSVKLLQTPAFRETPSLIFWDSLPATVTSALIKADVGDKAYGGHGAAMMHGDQLPKLGPAIRKSMSAMFTVNQNRDNIGRDDNEARYKTPGGKAWKFWATLRIEMSRPNMGTHKDFYWDPEGQKDAKTRKANPEGFWVCAHVLKNKVGVERVSCYFPVVTVTQGEPNDTGPDPSATMWEVLCNAGLLTSGGSWWNLKDYPRPLRRADWRTIFIELYPHCLDLIADPANKMGVKGEGFKYTERARYAVDAQMEKKFGHLRAEARKILKLDA